MKDRRILLIGSMSLIPFSAFSANKENVPNIIFILADDMGYGDLCCYGQPYIKTPNIDRMASEGMRFTQAYSGSPVSAPSRATLMTGQHTGHTLIRGNKGYARASEPIMYGKNQDWSLVGQHPYDPEHIILPEILKANGYVTSLFGKWAGGYEGSVSTPDKRGIDEFFGYLCQTTAHLYYPNFLNEYIRERGDTATTRVILEENIKYPMFGDGYESRTQYSADMIHRRAMEWLEKQDKDKPFVSFLTYTLPHAELVQPNDSLLDYYKQAFYEDKTWGGNAESRYNPTTHTHAQFAAMISRLDCYVGEILDKLKEKGLDENTIVILTSDNGPHEEGGADPAFFGRDGKLRGLKRACYEGGIRVPFIVRWGEHVKAGTTTDHQIAFYDVLPTFCEMIGLKNYSKKYLNSQLNNDCFDGISFLPTLLGKEQKEKHEYLYWEFSETDQFAVRWGDWKLVVIKGKPYLYDLSTDIHEDHDLAGQHPDIVKQMIEFIHREHTDNSMFPVTMPRMVTNIQDSAYARYYDKLPTPIEPIRQVIIPSYAKNLKDYGAVGNGIALCTESFQTAIDDLAAHGGGKLIVPKGIWLTGPIELKDNIELHVEKNAVIYFSPDKQLFLNADTAADRALPCIRAVGRKNIAITGQGIIDGNGKQWRYISRKKMSDEEWSYYHELGGVDLYDGRFWYPWKMKSGYADIAATAEQQEHLRNDLIRIIGCENVAIKDVTIQNPPRFHVHPISCKNVIIDGLTVRAPWNAQNSDGIDLTDCHQVLVVNNVVDVGDDGICLKSEKPHDGKLNACRDIVVENNVVYNAHGGFVLGSMTAGGMYDIVVRNNSYIGTDVGLRFKSGPDRGGRTERIFVSNIMMADIKDCAIEFQCDYKNRPQNKLMKTLAAEYGQWIPDFQDIHISKVYCREAKTAIKAKGIVGMKCINNIEIKKSTFVYTHKASAIDKETTDIKMSNVEFVSYKKDK